MTFYDLNVPYNEPNEPGITNTLRFLSELGYTTVALSQSLTGKLPAVVSPLPLPTNVPPSITLLTRLNITLSDSTQNQRLAALAQSYSLIAIRPVNEKTLSQACNSLDCDIISLDLSTRLSYHFKFKTLSAAISRGVRLEICYGPGVTGSGLESRRNLIGNAAALIRAARGRGIIISSEAKQALGIRAPWDIVNLACVWGMKSERAKEAVSEEARKVVDMARVKRTSFRGTVDVIYGGEEDEGVAKKADQEYASRRTTVIQTGDKTAGKKGQTIECGHFWRGLSSYMITIPPVFQLYEYIIVTIPGAG
ncbi:ribonuclease P protein subunit p30 [Microsporum canis CBS 113480]|uniref:Ribonuclease P protein subunit p30 n=1 Tax=Arthroderma otae (strain ATCC MYA-4605 / CBS 113480) TaxID=554155 RepID=C5FX84_ARTOC|nr:ribonuclease P protein subunit p30 [Microsporum canis CBS 113480]EEQ34924.1 ribonuclease P protein subunit p30 [Microsporum canis CBS 113480]